MSVGPYLTESLTDAEKERLRGAVKTIHAYEDYDYADDPRAYREDKAAFERGMAVWNELAPKDPAFAKTLADLHIRKG